MPREEIVTTIEREKVIAIVRLEGREKVVPVVRAIHAGGVRCIEVSLTTPGALDAIAEIAASHPEVVIGAGTVCTPEEVERSAAAGARFIVTPATLPELIGPAHALGLPVAMGAFTPTEAYVAHRAGADLIKLFPAFVLGPGYLRAVRAPFPALRLVPTGGVDLGNAREWLDAGAVALGIGGGLTDAAAIAAGDYATLTAHAAALVERLR